MVPCVNLLDGEDGSRHEHAMACSCPAGIFARPSRYFLWAEGGGDDWRTGVTLPTNMLCRCRMIKLSPCVTIEVGCKVRGWRGMFTRNAGRTGIHVRVIYTDPARRDM